MDGLLSIDPDDSLTAEASSIADVGGLHAHGFGEIREQDPTHTLGNDIVRNAVAAAVETFQVVIAGPPGPVTTSFNMHLSGQLDALTTRTAAGDNQAGSNVYVWFRVNGTTLPGAPARRLRGVGGSARPLGSRGRQRRPAPT